MILISSEIKNVNINETHPSEGEWVGCGYKDARCHVSKC